VKWLAFVIKTLKKNLLRRWDLHLTGVAPTIRHLKPIIDVVFCKDSGKELKIVSFSRAECMHELLCFGILFGGFLFVSVASNVHNKTSDDWDREAGFFWLWGVGCT
jgi:hypothetical protein